MTSIDRSGAPVPFEQLSTLACRCKACRDGDGWRVEASAFLCPDRHAQGDFVAGEDEARRRMVEREWERAERDMLT